MSIDLLRGLVMTFMALDHVRMYFALGTWYVEPTDLSTTTPLLFFTRWITHFCAPVFIFLAGTSAFLHGTKKTSTKELSWFLFTRGLWLIFAELVIVNFAWTFDITYSFLILQVIWAAGISMIVLSALIFLPNTLNLGIGMILVFGHNLLDSIQMQEKTIWDFIWYTLHQPKFLTLDANHVVNFVYPVLPWIGLMALGYVCGTLYKKDFPAEKRKRWLVSIAIGALILFVTLRAFNIYGEPSNWEQQNSPAFYVDVISKYDKISSILTISTNDHGACVDFSFANRLFPKSDNSASYSLWQGTVLLLYHPPLLYSRPCHAISGLCWP